MFNDVISDVFYAGCAMRGEILVVERRRFWHDDDKLEIVMLVGVGGAELRPVFRTVCLLALRGHFPSHIFESLFWRFVADA